MKLVEMIEDRDWGYAFLNTCRNVGRLLKNRPLLTCPFCKGKRGAIQGYYEPEWDDCDACGHYWQDMEDNGWRWFVGRLPVWSWLEAKVSIWCGFWRLTRLRDIARCKLGIHHWINEDEITPGYRVCCVCWKDKTVATLPTKDGAK